MAQTDILDPGGAQLRVGYDAANYVEVSVDASGDATITPTGGVISIPAHVLLGGASNAGRIALLEDAASGYAALYMSGSAGDPTNYTLHLKPVLRGSNIDWDLVITSIGVARPALTIAGMGAWLFGTTDPSGASAGDLVTASGRGLVCTTPDGTKRYRISVDNGGAITSTLL